MRKQSLICLVVVFIGLSLASYADNNQSKDDQFYFFRGIDENTGSLSVVTFYVESMPKDLAIKKANLWQAAEKELKRLAVVCPESKSDDPQAFMDWKDNFAKKSQRLNRILDKFYAIKGDLGKVTVSDDELSRLTVLNSDFGDILHSYIVERELIGMANHGRLRIYHSGFVRFESLKINK